MIKKFLKFLLAVIIFIIILVLFFKINIIREYFEVFAIWLFPENPNRNGELFKIGLSVLGGLGILFGLYISLRRAKAIEEGVRKQGKAINLQSDQIELTRRSQTDERFKNAVEHLGSKSEPIILGGIAELNQIVKEYKTEYSEIVFNILISYVRSNAKNEKNRTVLQTIINNLFENSEGNPYKSYKANLRGSDLIGVEFKNVVLDNSDLSKCKLSVIKNSSFKNVDLQYSQFFFGEINTVDFSETKMHNTFFYGGRMADLNFNINTEFGTIGFFDLTFENVNFDKCNVHEWLFIACNFLESSFNETDILYSKFALSNFEKVKFKNVNTFSKNDFRGAYFNSTIMENITIMNSNFKGIRDKNEFSLAFRDRIEELLEYETTYAGIESKNINFYKCDTGKLEISDLNEILQLLDKYKDKAFDKK